MRSSIGEVDFYGDSYGTFVGQILAGLYPTRLRSIVLDSAYPVRPPDEWFPTDWAKAWDGHRPELLALAELHGARRAAPVHACSS